MAAGRRCDTQPKLEAQDAAGNLGINFDVSTVPGTQVHLVLHPSSGALTGTLAGTTTVDAHAGYADFAGQGVNITGAGDYTISGTAVGASWSGVADATSSTISIAQNDTSTTVTGVPTSSVYGQTVIFTATVVATGPGVGMPAGSVQFSIDGSTVGSPVVPLGAPRPSTRRPSRSR